MPDSSPDHWLRRIKIKYRIPIIVALGVASCGFAVLLAVQHAERQYVQLEKQNTRDLVETARNLVNHYHSLAERDVISEIDAKRLALGALKEIGLSDRSYVYVYHDLNFMVMHPSLPEQSMPDFTPEDLEQSQALANEQMEQHRVRYGLDERRRSPMEILFKHHPETKTGFFDYVYFIDDDGLGFIAETNDAHIPKNAPQKIGYGSYFAPWGWSVLGGVYLGDLELAINESLSNLLPPLLLAFLLLIFASWTISRSITVPIATGIERLNRLLTEKNFDPPEASKGDEMFQLSQAFDALLDQIEARDESLTVKSRQLAATNRELIEHKQSLEKTVEARTHEYKVAKDEAEEATKAKSEFLATMSHELRTPMSGVIGIVDLLKETELNPVQQEYINIISASGNQLLDLVGDILNYEKLVANKLELEKIAFDLPKLCEELVMPFKLRARDKTGLEINIDYDQSCPAHIMGDPLRVKQIINNFLSNAFKFTDKGSITVRVKQTLRDTESLVHVAVLDTGIGISEDKQSRLFQDFQQADCATSRKYGGTGLGLSISKKIAELMGGQVGVRSELGQGSCFYLEFPLVPAQKVTDFSPGKESVDTNPGVAHLRVLVAEDNAVNQMVIKGYLKRLGIEPDLAENGEIALKYFRGREFDLILMDISMPLMDGVEATRGIRELEKQAGKSPV
ncbi:MAG: ATP-binding protein, partial [Cellvibrionaceae bacterium]